MFGSAIVTVRNKASHSVSLIQIYRTNCLAPNFLFPIFHFKPVQYHFGLISYAFIWLTLKPVGCNVLLVSKLYFEH